MIDNLLHILTINRLDAFIIFVVYPIVFVVSWKLFEKVIFAPYIALFEAREGATTGAESSAGESIQEAQKLEKQYEDGLTEARAEAFQKKLRRLSAASREASEIILKAEETAAQEIQKARAEIEATQKSLRDEVFSEADALVDEIVGTLKKPATVAGKGA
jgi:F0F1-type ATP synthase membrane subunit b/b'